MASDRLIHFVCTSREHGASRIPGLTRHEGEWALCPQLLGDSHDWFDTGGVPVKQAVAKWRDLLSVEEVAAPAPAA